LHVPHLLDKLIVELAHLLSDLALALGDLATDLADLAAHLAPELVAELVKVLLSGWAGIFRHLLSLRVQRNDKPKMKCAATGFILSCPPYHF